MGGLDGDALAKHAPALVCMFDDDDADVRINALTALSFLSPESLAEHAYAVVEMVKDHVGDVRDAAVDVLELLDLDGLRHHAGAIRNFFKEDPRSLTELEDRWPGLLKVMNAHWIP